MGKLKFSATSIIGLKSSKKLYSKKEVRQHLYIDERQLGNLEY